MTTWNPWHGCTKMGSGCSKCYVYRCNGRVYHIPRKEQHTQAAKAGVDYPPIISSRSLTQNKKKVALKLLRIIVLISIIGFFSGSILYAELIPKAVCGIDIVTCSADGNPGTANVYALCGKKCGTLTAILEFAKGFFPVLLGNILIPSECRTYTFALIIIAPVMGHIFSVFHNWNGGLGIATTFGTMIAVFLQSRLLILLVEDYTIGKFLLKFRHKHHRTLFVFGAFLVELLLLNNNDAYSLAYFCIACVIILKCIALKYIK